MCGVRAILPCVLRMLAVLTTRICEHTASSEKQLAFYRVKARLYFIDANIDGEPPQSIRPILCVVDTRFRGGLDVIREPIRCFCRSTLLVMRRRHCVVLALKIVNNSLLVGDITCRRTVFTHLL